MAKVKIEVLDAVIDGKSKGETLQVDERSARFFESIGYARLLEEKQTKQPKQTKSEKGTSAPKKDTSKSDKNEDKKE